MKREVVRYKFILDSGVVITTGFKEYDKEEAETFLNAYKNPSEYDSILIKDRDKKMIIIPMEAYLKSVFISETKFTRF